MRKKPLKGFNPISACCKSPVKIKGIPDFIGSNEIRTTSYFCSSCSKPCDIYVSPKEQAKIDKEVLKEKLECILDNLLARFLPRPSPKFEKYVNNILSERNNAIEEIIELINNVSIFKAFYTDINPLDIKLGTKLVKNCPYCPLCFKSQECGYKGKKFTFCNKTKEDCRTRKRLDSFEKNVWNGEKI